MLLHQVAMNASHVAITHVLQIASVLLCQLRVHLILGEVEDLFAGGLLQLSLHFRELVLLSVTGHE